jgi:hypothetical protein
MTTITKHNSLTSGSSRSLNWALMTTCAISAASLPLAAEEAKTVDPTPPSRVHALVNVEVSNEYLTPRGMIVENKGVVIQPLVLAFVNLYKGDSFINDVTAVPGVWSSVHTHKNTAGGTRPNYWNEVDPILGLNTTFAKDFTLSLTYTAFQSQNATFPTSQHLETKLVFDDSKYLKAFALHPYFIYWQELEHKATDADVPNLVFPTATPNNQPGPSYYFDVGITPSYTFEKISLKVEAPIRALFPDKRFYGEYYGKSSTVGLYELGLKGTIPMNFMPKGYGNWSFHAGVRYMKFVDRNLIGLQNFLAPGKPTTDTVQVYGGVSTFF